MSDGLCVSDDLRPASFRGVGFWVENDRGQYGRRIVTHEFPMRDDPYNEDLGEKAREFSVSGYVLATSEKDDVVGACTARGPAMLCLPADSPFMAVCKSITVQRSKERQGYFELQMQFTEDPGEGVMPAPEALFEGMIVDLGYQLASALTPIFEGTFSARDVLPFVVTGAELRVVTFASTMISALEGVGADDSDDRISKAITTTIRMAQNVAGVVRPSTNDPPASSTVTVIGDLFDTLNNYPAVNVMTAVVDMASFSVSETDGPVSTSRSAQQDYMNAAMFCGTVRKFALIAYARAASVADYASRKDAITMRASLMQAFEQEMNAVMDETVWNILASARDYAVKAITEQAATLVPVVIVNSPTTLPSLYWAYRLYGDASRALELSDRNDVATPAFMPQEFEALRS